MNDRLGDALGKDKSGRNQLNLKRGLASIVLLAALGGLLFVLVFS